MYTEKDHQNFMPSKFYFKQFALGMILAFSVLGTCPVHATESHLNIVTQLGHGPQAIDISHNGSLVVSGSYDGSVKLWDVMTGKEIRVFSSGFGSVDSVVFSPNDHQIAATNGKTLTIWSVDTGNAVHTIQGVYIRAASFSPDGKQIVTGDATKIRVWDVSTGKEVHTLVGHMEFVNTIAFSPNGKQILSGSADKTLKLWDTVTGKEISSWPVPGIQSVAFSPDGKWLAAGRQANEDKTLKIWDVTAGKETASLPDESAAITFSPDSQLLISASYKSVQIWDVNTHKMNRSLDGHSQMVTSVAISPNGKQVVSGGTDRTVKLWDIVTGQLLHTFTGHTASINSVAFSPNGKWIVSAGFDGYLNWWDAQTKKLIYSSVLDNDGEYLNWTPDGYFDGSRNSGHLVAFVQGLQGYAPDQFAIKYNRPDILLQRMGYPDQNLITHYQAQYQKRLRKSGLTEDQLFNDRHAPTAEILSLKQQGKQAELSIKLTDSLYNLRTYNIFINDVPLYSGYGKLITGKAMAFTETVELSSGDNKIEVSTFNEKGTESFRALTVAKYDQKVQGDLYFIGIGTSKFKDTSLNLLYPDKDAKDMGQMLQGLQGKYQKVNIKTLLNEQVTTANIRQLKGLLKDAKVDDTVVLFIAGHGTHSQDAEANYYYLTHDVNLSKLKDTAAEFELIEDILAGIKPRTKLFLMDTCESGELDDTSEQQTLQIAASRGLKARTTRGVKIAGDPTAQKKPTARPYLFDTNRYIYNDVFRRTGAVVFSSSRGGEFSYEPPPPYNANENGFFTKALLQGLGSAQADANKDGWVSKTELKDYVTQAVSSRSQGLQNPTIDRDNLSQKMELPIK